MKKQIRKNFRKEVFARDKNICRTCGFKSDNPEEDLDPHHITDRNEMPHGGYVKENGISLCKQCHWKAEAFHRTGISEEGFSPEDLYSIIESSKEKAIIACGMIRIN